MFKLVVLSCVVAVASAGALISGLAPLAYSAPYGYSPLAYSGYFYNPSNYRGPLSLAPGQPANILGSDGRPLDTLDVNLDRSAHFTAKALGGHILKKRSVAAPILAPLPSLAYSASYLAPSPYINSGLYASPIRAFSYPYAASYAQW